MDSPRQRWTYTVYHDEPEDAATDAFTHSAPYVTEQDAIAGAVGKAERDDYWNGGATIEVGEWYPETPGVEPAYWENTVTTAYVFDGQVDRLPA